MAMMPPSVRLPNKAAHEPTPLSNPRQHPEAPWPSHNSISHPHHVSESHERDADEALFDQFIDSDPIEMSNTSSSDHTGDPSEFSLFFEVPGSPEKADGMDPSTSAQPQSGVQVAPKLQDQSASLQEAAHSPPFISTDASRPQKHHESSSTSDAFPLSPCSRPSSSALRHHSKHHSNLHQRTASDSSTLSIDSAALDLCGPVDSAALPFDLDHDLIVSSPVMAQPMISRHSTHDAWANRLEQRAEHYTYQPSSHATPLTPPPQHVKQSPTMRSNGTSTQYYQGVSTPANYALGQSPPAHTQLGPYQRSSPTPVTPNFNDFAMDSVIASPQGEHQQSWNENSTSPFELPLDASQQQYHHSMPSHEEGKVQPWWPPASSGAASSGSQYGTRTHRQTSAPAMPPSQAQYGGYYPSTTSSGLMLNCQPGATEMGPPSMPYATSAPVGHSYPRHPSMPQLGPSRRPSMQMPSSGTSSSASSRRTSKSQQSRIHGRSKSSASPPRQGMRDAPSSGNVGFVNFTPHDSKRILTGVAPSGSSKTKARREKEARERRKQLSEAAQRAVMEAGGDPAALERSGLFT